MTHPAVEPANALHQLDNLRNLTQQKVQTNNEIIALNNTLTQTAYQAQGGGTTVAGAVMTTMHQVHTKATDATNKAFSAFDGADHMIRTQASHNETTAASIAHSVAI